MFLNCYWLRLPWHWNIIMLTLNGFCASKTPFPGVFSGLVTGCSAARRVTCWVQSLHDCCSDPGIAQPEMGFLCSALWMMSSKCSWEGAWQCHTQVPQQCYTQCSSRNKPEKPTRRLLICAKFWKCWSTAFRPRQYVHLPGVMHVPGQHPFSAFPAAQSETSDPGWPVTQIQEWSCRCHILSYLLKYSNGCSAISHPKPSTDWYPLNAPWLLCVLPHKTWYPACDCSGFPLILIFPSSSMKLRICRKLQLSCPL